jgi:hypothetical protein
MRRATLWSNHQSQVIVLMGFLLVIAVLIIASYGVELAELDVLVTSERSSSLLTEFQHIQPSFGVALNYYLVDLSISRFTSNSYYVGNISTLPEAFNQTRGKFHRLELTHNIYFDATLNAYWYSYTSYNGDIYSVDVTLKLDDGATRITQNVTYSVVCLPKIYY